MNSDLAAALSILRTIRGWSQGDLASAAQVTNSAISDYERGKVDPQMKTLQKMVRALGLPLSALDQTFAFILLIRSQMGEDPKEAGSLEGPGEDLRTEIAEVSAEGGRFASRLTRLMLHLLAGRG